MEDLTSTNMSKNCEFNHINNEEGNASQESNKVDTKDESKESAQKEENEFLESKDRFKKDVDTNMTNKSLEREEDLANQQLDKVKGSSVYKKFSMLIDSDSENESIFPTTLRKGKSDHNNSEDEESESEHNISFKKISNKKSVGKSFLDSDSDDGSNFNNASDNEERNLNVKKAENSVPNRFQTLIDSESEEEVEEHEKHSNPIKSNKKQKDENSKSQTRKVSARASKDEAMKQIQRETQRLIRETEVSLPYHRPKQRTLQEFLSRKKVASVLPKAPTMAAKLKMSYVIVDEALKKKEKEAEIFYKSSDSEEETESNSFSDKKSTNVESTQELNKDRVSRQLFGDHNSLTNNDEEKSKETSSVLETEVMEADIIEPGTTEHDKTITNDLIENNINEPVVLETHCEANNIENENEIIEKVLETSNTTEFNVTEVDDSVQRREVVQRKDEEVENNSVGKSINNEIVNSNTVNETLNTSTANANDSYATMVKKSLGVTTEESDDYNEYGLPPPVFDDSPDINRKKKLLNVTSLKPKLRGREGVMIDLTDDIKPNKKGIDALINRFVCKHSIANEKIDNKPDVAVTKTKGTLKGLTIVKETVPHKLLTLHNDDPKLQVPGAKLVRLREELKYRIALKRDEELKQREQDMKEQEIEWNESINTEDHVSEPYSPSIESYISKENESEEDEEEDEDMYMMKEKKRSKCAFLDNEAEVSDNEMDDNDEIIEEDEDVDENEEENEKETESLVLDDEDEDGTNTCDSSDTFPKRKSFKRIVKPSEDDTRSCDTENNEETSNDKKTSLRTMISEDMFSGSINENKGASDAESDIPVSQTYVENDLELQMTQTPQTKTSSYKFISPLTQLTVLNTNLESENESAKVEHYSLAGESNLFSIDSTQSEKSSQQICHLKIQTPQRKLFAAEVNVTDEDLMQLCSGKFTQNSSTLNFSKEPAITESQLLDICSGSFNTQVTDEKELINDFANDRSSKKGAQNREGESKKERKVFKLSIVSSDEEELMEKEIKNRSKKKVKKLNLSDDEEETGSLASDGEYDDENDEDDEEKYVDYDSEENEVVVPKKNIKKYAAEFLEEEAELSESDGDVSADEDEKDLDKLEFEEGDDEDIDEAQIQKQLGKLHAKQLLDEDQKEVRILKELLFEDGDLYSESGRERKFKWRNIDKQSNNDQSDPVGNNDSRVDLSDGEDEWKWRKVMYEREQFIEQNAINIDTEIENNLSNSQIFKFGMKILKKRRIDETQKQDTLLDVDESKKELIKPHSIADMLNGSKLEGKSRVIHNVLQKRSFLAKGEETLARLAVLAKQKDAPLSSMHKKNFVFAHIDPSTEVESTLATEPEAESHKWKRKR